MPLPNWPALPPIWSLSAARYWMTMALRGLVARAPFVANGDDGETAVLLRRIVQVDHDRQQVEVGVWEKRVVLVPLEPRLAVAGRLEIELGVVQLNVRTDQVLHDVQDFRIEDQVGKGLMVN